MMRACLLLLLLTLPSWAAETGDMDRRMTAIRKQLAALPELPAPQPAERVGFHSQFAGTTQAARWVQVDLGAVRDFDSVVVVPAFVASTEQGSGAYGMPPRFRVDVSDTEDFGSYQTLADHTEADVVASPSPVFIAAKARGRYVRFTATRLVMRGAGRGFFALGELMVFAGEINVAAGAAVTSSGANESSPTWMLGNLTDGFTHLGAAITPGPQRSNGWHSAIASAPDQTLWVQVDLGTVQPLDEVRLYPAHPPDFPERPGFGFPVRFCVETADEPSFASRQSLLDATIADYVNPADNPVSILMRGMKARCVRVTATTLWKRSGDYVFALAELEAWGGGKNVARGAAVTSKDETKNVAWNAANLVDGQTSLGFIQSWPRWLEQLSQRQELKMELAALEQRRIQMGAERQRLWIIMGGAAALVLMLGAWLLHRRQRLQQSRAVNDLRRQIARDLHDEIGSSLGSIALMSELALRDGESPALQDIQRLSREAAESMRGIIWLVRESGTPTLERLVETMRETAGRLLSGVRWSLEAPQEPAPPASSLDFHRHVFLFFKEAVYNAARHARAKRVNIRVQWTARELTLIIEDDGCGFDVALSTGGSGLGNLRHRAAALGGSVMIHSSLTEGTRITLIAPLS